MKPKRAKFSKSESYSKSSSSDFETKDMSSDSNFCPSEDYTSKNKLMMPIQSKPVNLKDG